MTKATVHRLLDRDADDIQHGLPIPPKQRNGPSSPVRAKIELLEIGDSFFLPNVKRTTAPTRYSKLLKIKLVQRRIGNGIRIWRTA